MQHSSAPGPGGDAGPAFLQLGEVLRPHGLRGELRVRLLTDYPERITELKQVHLATTVAAQDARAWKLQYMRMHQRYGLVKLVGVDDRNAAELLRGLKVMVAIEEAVPLEEEEFYLFQLIGLKVMTTGGCNLGRIRDIIETGANDVYIVDSPAYGEILIPATAETIVETSIAAGYLRVQLPDGLLPA